MNRHLLVLATVALASCGKSAQDKADDVLLCSNLESTGSGMTKCLLDQGGWKRAAAESAGAARQHEVDSTNAQIAAIAARTETQQHGQIGLCDATLVDMKDCLVTRFGWDAYRAAVVDDSVWRTQARLHAKQLKSCGAPRSGTGMCLQLRYKWIPRRALAIDDSLRRAH